MEISSSKILRKSIHNFLANYQYFSYFSCLLALPFSTAILLSQYFCLPSSSSPLFRAIFNGFHNAFESAKLSSSSQYFTLKLSQTLTSFTLSLPCNLTFLLLAKSSVIQALSQSHFSSLFSIYSCLLLSYICNSFIIISTNAMAFIFLGFFTYNSYLLMAFGGIVYSLLLANVVIVSNLSLALSGSQLSSGFSPFFRTLKMIRGRTFTALSIAWPVMLASAGVEALFQHRILIEYLGQQRMSYIVIVEGILMAYIYSVLIVYDTIACCIFIKSCIDE